MRARITLLLLSMLLFAVVFLRADLTRGFIGSLGSDQFARPSRAAPRMGLVGLLLAGLNT